MTYAKWSFPDGSVAWGPRFLLPWCALLVIPLGALWEEIPRWPRRYERTVARSIVATLGVLSAVVVIASVWVPYTQYWSEVGDPTGVSQTELRAVIDRRIDDSFNQLEDTPILVNLGDLDEGKPFPLFWFRGGPTLLGILAIATSVAASSLAIGQAASADRRRRARVATGTRSPATARKRVRKT